MDTSADTATSRPDEPTAAPASSPAAVMSYARARLYLGSSNVGMWVVVSSAFLLFGVPERIFRTSPAASWADVTQLAAVILVYAAVQGAFDLFGGLLLPKEYGRYTPPLPKFVAHWFRGAALHGALLLAAGLLLLNAARLGGFWGALAAFLLLSAGLVLGQLGLARLIGGLGVARREGVVLLRSPYPHLTGGVVGVRRETVALPEAWAERFGKGASELLLERRRALVARGSRRYGLAAALFWNLLGFVLAYAAAGSVASVAGLVSFSLWSTLWAFLGVLTLPTLSRRAVFQGDALALEGGGDRTQLGELIVRLDRDQDDEAGRDPAVETIFHPLPSSTRRLARLGLPPPRWALWHVARTSLYLSWASLSLLSRAVHCNVGRPEVWVFLPSD